MHSSKKMVLTIFPTKGNLFSHLIVILVCICIFAGALIFTPAESQISPLRLGNVYMPDICVFKNLTGLPCPGCGLSRSIVAAVHGDVNLSLMHHRLGLLILLYILSQFVYRLGLILVPVRGTSVFRFERLLNRGIVILGILLMLNWILTLLFLRSSSII